MLYSLARTLTTGWFVCLVPNGVRCLLLVGVLLATANLVKADGEETTNESVLASSTVGLPAHLRQLVIAGPELTVKPLDDRHQPFVLRIEQVFQHGSDHRYDLEFYALEPGTYDLRDYLVPAVEPDAAAEAVTQTPLLVRVDSKIPAGQVTPTPLAQGRLPVLGGYRLMMILAGVLWLVGLFALVFSRKKHSESTDASRPSQMTVADRLRPLIVKARDGQLTAGQEAELERTLIALWCQRLQLHELGPAEAFQRLKQHPQAGTLLVQLEQWLHNPTADKSIDLAELLAPYESMSAEQWDTEHAAASRDSQLEATT